MRRTTDERKTAHKSGCSVFFLTNLPYSDKISSMIKRKFSSIILTIFTVIFSIVIALSCFGCTKGAGSDKQPDEDKTENPPSTDGPSTDGPAQDENPPAWASNFDLPDGDIALTRLCSLYGGADKVFLLQSNKIARMPCPQGEVVTLNVPFTVGEYARLILDDSIAEFNEVFAVINPNYKFAVNYSPTEEDLAKKYSIKLTASDNLAVTETSQVFGVAHVSYYSNFTELGDFGITIKSEVFNNGSYLMTTFKHELMHLLGAGDAYKNSTATKDTVMQSYTVKGYHHLSETDVAFLDTLYRNPEFAGEDEKIGEYIENYEQNCPHTREKLTAAVYHKLVSSLKSKEVTDTANEIGYKDLTDFAAAISGGVIPDTSFGSKNISFKEIEYAETPAETYYGSINAENRKYEHGRQKGFMGSSQTISYTDYGGGLIYAAPNGNLYTLMIKTGEFILAFRLAGSFTNFAALSLTLWHISK